MNQNCLKVAAWQGKQCEEMGEAMLVPVVTIKFRLTLMHFENN